DDVGIARIVWEGSVGRARVWGQGRAWALSRAVEAPDRLDRAVPELEEPFTVLVLHLLADVERRRATGLIVHPGQRTADVVDEAIGGAVGRRGEEIGRAHV